MMNHAKPVPHIAIACGGTGGHLFPGLAVADAFRRRGGRVTLLISQKEIDRQGASQARDMDIVVLPAVGLQRGGILEFLRGFWRSYRASIRQFQSEPPHAALAMGGFTSAPPILAAKRFGARAFLHESNAIPGRANRWLSRTVDEAFIGFSSASARLHTRNVTVCGTPVRRQFFDGGGSNARAAFGLDAAGPVLLIMGGSQGASGINNLMLGALPTLRKSVPDLQFLHLTGQNDYDRVQTAYLVLGARAAVHRFLPNMDDALRSATLAVSRSGASSLAEIAAVGTPALLVPFPAATDNHQWHNARAYETTGAARMVEHKSTAPEEFAGLLQRMLADVDGLAGMKAALARWRHPDCAERIAEHILGRCALETTSNQDIPSRDSRAGGGNNSVGTTNALAGPNPMSS